MGLVSLGGVGTEAETVWKSVGLGSEETAQWGVENLGKHVIIDVFNVQFCFLS